MDKWTALKEKLVNRVSDLSIEHKKKLQFEIEETEKQGFEAYWVKAYESNNKYASNPNKVLIPYLLDMVDEDPIEPNMLLSTKFGEVQKYAAENGKIPPYIFKDADMPDIDIDCIPEARDMIKQYAIEKYGEDYVCSVGTWQTFKFKSAMIDVAVALGLYKDRYEIEKITTELPVDVDALKDEGMSACKGNIKDAETNALKECGHLHRELVCPKCGSEDTDGPNIAQILRDVPELRKFYEKAPRPGDKYSNKDVVEYSLGLIGKIRSIGMHAGALIISDQKLFGNIPMSMSASKDLRQSMWSEGRNPQLSKWGYVKWDMLGLKTQAYIFNCCNLIKENRGISFGELLEGWEYIKPLQRIAGYYEIDGEKHYISLDDPHALRLANLQMTDGVFQFDTDLAKCCKYDSLIDTDCGKIRIDSLSPAYHQIKYLDDDGTIKYTNNYNVVKSDVKEIIKITLEDGSILNLSEDHRVLTNRGYVRVKDLNDDDEIIESKNYMH